MVLVLSSKLCYVKSDLLEDFVPPRSTLTKSFREKNDPSLLVMQVMLYDKMNNLKQATEQTMLKKELLEKQSGSSLIPSCITF